LDGAGAAYPANLELEPVARACKHAGQRIDELLRASGRSLEPEGDEPVPELVHNEPALAARYAAAA
jgi:hypothetical protein